ncbi:Mitochondrial distribution and morphology protein 32 [Nakaseomyces glabratus]|nr:Mitochondrial distribution and morphology protein 32 [Nakaseomyces glabratus]KTB24120.1 Mitochondrial distribution and morphology protein 32 [Nakaseomyces glabratus]
MIRRRIVGFLRRPLGSEGGPLVSPIVGLVRPLVYPVNRAASPVTAVNPVVRTVGMRFISGPVEREAIRAGISNNTDFLHVQNILLQKDQERQRRELLLKDADNFFERFKVKTKWVLIRGNRPFSKDEIYTLFSWLLLSQIVWIVVGTTTFLSLVIMASNTMFAKEFVGETLGNILNNNKYINGIDFTFKDAMVPEWKKKMIRFHNVTMNSNDKDDTKGVSMNLKLNQVEVSLSVVKWLSGKGLVNDISIFGISGDISINDKKESNVESLINWVTESNPTYELNNFTINDSSTVIHDKANNKHLNMNIYSLVIPRLRFDHLLTDIFSADVLAGSVNDSLFNIHKRQNKLLPAFFSDKGRDNRSKTIDKNENDGRFTNLRLNAININELNLNRTGAFNWIDDGTIEISADIMIPNTDENNEGNGLKTLLGYPGGDPLVNKNTPENKYVVIDVKFKFKDLKTKFPNEEPKLSSGEKILSLNELKPVIAYVNSRSGFIHFLTSLEDSNQSRTNVESVDDNKNWGLSNISIRRKKSYPNTTVISSKPYWNSTSEDNERNLPLPLNQEIIKFHNISVQDDNELVLRCRIVQNVEQLENLSSLKISKMWDTITMEMYMDLLKVVEDWEYRNKNDWMKQWGATFASQLLLVGFGAMV